jgi:hypothetical protein
MDDSSDLQTLQGSRRRGRTPLKAGGAVRNRGAVVFPPMKRRTFYFAFAALMVFQSSAAIMDQEMDSSHPSERRLVEAEFAFDDKASTVDFHTVYTYWISETNKGFTRNIYNWAKQGGSGADAGSHEEAAECLNLLKFHGNSQNQKMKF